RCRPPRAAQHLGRGLRGHRPARGRGPDRGGHRRRRLRVRDDRVPAPPARRRPGDGRDARRAGRRTAGRHADADRQPRPRPRTRADHRPRRVLVLDEAVRRYPRGARAGRRDGGELMYAWLFRHLPGPLWVRIVIVVLLLAAIVAALFGWVFPALAPYLPFDDG